MVANKYVWSSLKTEYKHHNLTCWNQFVYGMKRKGNDDIIEPNERKLFLWL